MSVVQVGPSMRRNDAPADSSPPKPNDPSIRPGTNHLKPTGTSTIGLPSDVGDPVDHRRGHQRLADPGGVRPAGAGAAEEVADRDGQEVVGVHQPGVRRDDAVPVGVGVVAGGEVVLVLAPDQRRHRVRRGAVHPDLAVPVERHEAPGRVDQRVDHGEVQPVPLGDRAPVVDARAAQRVGADPHAGLADRVEVDDVRQVVDVRPEEVVRRRRRPGPRERDPLHVAQPPRISSLARFAISGGGVAVGRAAVRRVVLEAAVGGRVVRRGDHDAVGQARARGRAAVGADDRVRDRRGGRVAGRRSSTSTVTSFAASTSSAVAQAGSDRPWVSRPRNSGPSYPCSLAVLADRLRGREDVRAR